MIDLVIFAQELQRDEELRLKPYDDATGLPLKTGDTIKGKISIGVGRNLTDDGITAAEAKILLSTNMQNAVTDCLHAFDWWIGLDDVRQRVIANMVFNMGLGTLLTFTTFLTLMAQAKFQAAADDLLQTKWATEVGARAQRLAGALRTGQA